MYIYKISTNYFFLSIGLAVLKEQHDSDLMEE